MERNESMYSQIIEVSTKAGVKNSRIYNPIVFDNFPLKGTFVSYSIERFHGNPYLALHIDNGSLVSVSFILSQAFLGPKEKIELAKINNPNSTLYGCYYIKNTESINPHLSANQAEAVCTLLGKKYEAKLVSGYVIPFEKYTSIEKNAYKAIVLKSFYQISIRD